MSAQIKGRLICKASVRRVWSSEQAASGALHAQDQEGAKDTSKRRISLRGDALLGTSLIAQFIILNF